MPKISFIIPSYNSYKTISGTLDSIFRLNAFVQIHEVIVVDCSDDDKTRKILNEDVPLKISIIDLEQKSSPANSRNIGAAKATGDLLCFIDSDVVLDGFWLDNVVFAYSCGCKAGGGSVGVPYFQRKNLLALAQLYLQFNESLPAGKTRQVAMVPACNMFVQRQLFEQVGGFPQLRASEDVLFCIQCAQFSFLWFVPAAKCFHIFREEKNSYFQNQIILGQYIMVYRRMIYQKWYYKDSWPGVLLPFFLLIKMMRIINRIIKAGPAHLIGFILSFPLFLEGLFYWAKGFYQESRMDTLPLAAKSEIEGSKNVYEKFLSV